MSILVSNDRILSDIQREFSEKFSFLKIEFYHGEHDEGEGSSDKRMIDTSLSVGQLRNGDATTEFSIHGNLKTATFEETWQETFGFSVQVFRKSGNVWLQTTTTDSWTLAEQQREAEESASL